MVLSLGEVKECGPSSLNNISRPVCPGPVLMTSSLHRNALKQKAARGRAHFISRSRFPSLIPFLSLSEKISQSFTLPFPYLGRILPLLMFTVSFSIVFFSHRHSSALILLKQASLLLLFILTELCITRPMAFAGANDHVA